MKFFTRDAERSQSVNIDGVEHEGGHVTVTFSAHFGEVAIDVTAGGVTLTPEGTIDLAVAVLEANVLAADWAKLP